MKGCSWIWQRVPDSCVTPGHMKRVYYDVCRREVLMVAWPLNYVVSVGYWVLDRWDRYRMAPSWIDNEMEQLCLDRCEGGRRRKSALFATDADGEEVIAKGRRKRHEFDQPKQCVRFARMHRCWSEMGCPCVEQAVSVALYRRFLEQKKTAPKK